MDRLDQAFAALLAPATLGEQPSAQNSASGYHVSTTDRVRIRSVIEETRVIAVAATSKSSTLRPSRDTDMSETEESSAPDSDFPLNESGLDMRVSRIYERSLTLLGDSLG